MANTTRRQLKASIIRLKKSVTGLVRRREKHLKTRRKLNRAYDDAIRRRDAEEMMELGTRISELHRIELEPLNEMIARRETKIRIRQHLMTGN